MTNAEETTPDAPEEAESGPLEALQEENALLKDRLLRAMADADNIRKRAEREREDTARYAVSSFARDMVNVAENLKRALDSIPDGDNDPALKNLRAGVEMTFNELLTIFSRHGVRRIDPLGERFDHNFHQAVAQIDAPDSPAGTVVQVLQAGYAIHDRLLRPAMVGVAKAQGAEPPIVNTSA